MHLFKSVWFFGWLVLEHIRNMVQAMTHPSLDHLGPLQLFSWFDLLHCTFTRRVWILASPDPDDDDDDDDEDDDVVNVVVAVVCFALLLLLLSSLNCCCCCSCLHVSQKQCALIPQPKKHPMSRVLPGWVEACIDPKYRSAELMMHILCLWLRV